MILDHIFRNLFYFPDDDGMVLAEADGGGLVQEGLEVVGVGGDVHGGTAQHVGWPHQTRVADLDRLDHILNECIVCSVHTG